MKASSALALILDPAPAEGEVTFPEGPGSGSLEVISESTQIPLADLVAASQDVASLGLPAWAGTTPRASCSPRRTRCRRTPRPKVSCDDDGALFGGSADRAAGAARPESRLHPYEILIIASLIQAEGIEADFRQGRARHLQPARRRRALQIDATVNYALNKSELGLTNEDLKVDSPYNTYKVTGLPPTRSTRRARRRWRRRSARRRVTGSTTSPSTPATGETRFTASYDEFLRWKRGVPAQQLSPIATCPNAAR